MAKQWALCNRTNIRQCHSVKSVLVASSNMVNKPLAMLLSRLDSSVLLRQNINTAIIDGENIEFYNLVLLFTGKQNILQCSRSYFIYI